MLSFFNFIKWQQKPIKTGRGCLLANIKCERQGHSIFGHIHIKITVNAVELCHLCPWRQGKDLGFGTTSAASAPRLKFPTSCLPGEGPRPMWDRCSSPVERRAGKQWLTAQFSGGDGEMLPPEATKAVLYRRQTAWPLLTNLGQWVLTPNSKLPFFPPGGKC